MLEGRCGKLEGRCGKLVGRRCSRESRSIRAARATAHLIPHDRILRVRSDPYEAARTNDALQATALEQLVQPCWVKGSAREEAESAHHRRYPLLIALLSLLPFVVVVPVVVAMAVVMNARTTVVVAVLAVPMLTVLIVHVPVLVRLVVDVLMLIVLAALVLLLLIIIIALVALVVVLLLTIIAFPLLPAPPLCAVVAAVIDSTCLIAVLHASRTHNLPAPTPLSRPFGARLRDMHAQISATGR